MGCCISTSQAPHPSPYNAGDSETGYQSHAASHAPPTRGTSTTDTGREALLPRTGTASGGAAAIVTSHTAVSLAQVQRTEQVPPSVLRLPSQKRCRIPSGSTGTWSAARLASERTAFWETRVTGRSEVWQGLRLVVDLMQAGELDEAQAVLEAAGCVCPSGALWKYVYDAQGQVYEVPRWLIRDPVEIERDSGAESEEDVEEVEKEETVVRAGEKGKGRAADVGEMVKVRARLSDRATDVVVRLGTKESVQVLARRIEDQAGITTPGKVKIVYLGKLLDQHETLQDQNWREGHVVNALVFL